MTLASSYASTSSEKSTIIRSNGEATFVAGTHTAMDGRVVVVNASSGLLISSFPISVRRDYF